MSEDCLGGIVSKKTAAAMPESEWRDLQYAFMLDMQTRLGKLERSSSWRNIISAVPWTILGTLIGYCINMKVGM